jgi:FPC/CPF motif-containing protein YcgG
MPESVQQETWQMLMRFNGRLFFEIQEESKETSRQQSIANEKLDDLKSLVFELKAEMNDLRKDNNMLRQVLQNVRNALTESHQSPINQSLND